MNERYFIYGKVNGMKSYKAMDINEGTFVDKLIYATLIEDTERNRNKLQELADMNKEIGLVLQLRSNNGKSIYTTK